jgi:hypothetical protein
VEVNSDLGVLEGTNCFKHFLFGLKNGYAYGYPLYYTVFDPVKGISIPALKPHESTIITVYFKEYAGKNCPLAPNGETVN